MGGSPLVLSPPTKDCHHRCLHAEKHKNPGYISTYLSFRQSTRLEDVSTHHSVCTCVGQIRRYNQHLLCKQTGRSEKDPPSSAERWPTSGTGASGINHFMLSAVHIPGVINSLADSLSRHFHADHRWKLHLLIVQHTSQQCGGPIFGSLHNPAEQVPRVVLAGYLRPQLQRRCLHGAVVRSTDVRLPFHSPITSCSQEDQAQWGNSDPDSSLVDKGNPFTLSCS